MNNLLKKISQSRTYHKVPSTSNTIPFKGGALCLLLRSGSKGANIRGRPGTVVYLEEDVAILSDVCNAGSRGMNFEDSINEVAVMRANCTRKLRNRQYCADLLCRFGFAEL
jgi:hypothetical protein